MKPQWIAIPALTFGLLATANLGLAGQSLPDDGSTVKKCVTAAGVECNVVKTEDCTKYTVVHVKIGTETVITRQCSERTTKETYMYYA